MYKKIGNKTRILKFYLRIFKRTIEEIKFWYPPIVLGDSRKLSTVFTIDSFGKSIDSFDGIIHSFYIKNAIVNVPLPPKKKIFLLFSQKMILSLKKLLYAELFETSFPIKKGYIHFRHQTLPSLQQGLGPQKQFFAIFFKNTVLFWKNC